MDSYQAVLIRRWFQSLRIVPGVDSNPIMDKNVLFVIFACVAFVEVRRAHINEIKLGIHPSATVHREKAKSRKYRGVFKVKSRVKTQQVR